MEWLIDGRKVIGVACGSDLYGGRLDPIPAGRRDDFVTSHSRSVGRGADRSGAGATRPQQLLNRRAPLFKGRAVPAVVRDNVVERFIERDHG